MSDILRIPSGGIVLQVAALDHAMRLRVQPCPARSFAAGKRRSSLQNHLRLSL